MTDNLSDRLARGDPDRAAREFFGCKTLDGGVTDHSYDCADIPWKTPGEYACVRLTTLLGRWRAQAVEECAVLSEARTPTGRCRNCRRSVHTRGCVSRRIRALAGGAK